MKKTKVSSKRVRLDAATWAMLLEVRESGDLTVKDFCKSQGISVASYYQWHKRLRGEGFGVGTGLFHPIEIQVKQIGEVIVELPGGVLLRFSELPPVGYLRELSSNFSGLL